MHVCFASQLWNKLHRFVALIAVIAHICDSYENNGIHMLCFSKINLTGRKLSDDELINLVKQTSDLILN